MHIDPEFTCDDLDDWREACASGEIELKDLVDHASSVRGTVPGVIPCLLHGRLFFERPELTPEDLAFARLCGALAHRPQLTECDRDFAQLIDDLTFTFDFYAQPHWFIGREIVWMLVCRRFEELAWMVQGFMSQPVSEAQGCQHRHKMYSHGEEGSDAELHVPETWRSPKPKRNAWQRAADKLAQQISMPLDAMFAERRKVG